MKPTRKRILSLLTAGAMTLSLLPSMLPALPALPAAANPVFGDDDFEDDTDLTINFDQDAPGPEDAFNQIGAAGSTRSSVGIDYYRSNYNKFHWRHVRYWTCNNEPDRKSWVAWKCGFRSDSEDWKKIRRENFYGSMEPVTLRYCLEATGEENTYVALAEDDVHEEHERDVWQPIRITEDKVLDLNGHTLAIQYNRNRNNSDENKCQNLVDTTTHNCWAFEITNGATLTIIDSSAWRGENGGNGSGSLSFTGYMVDPFEYGIVYNTTRDMFHVDNGNLVIYGGTYQAGRKKDQLKKNFTWSRLKTVIGTAVELGVNIAEYSTGLNLETAKYEDVLAKLKQSVEWSAIKESDETGEDDGDISNGKIQTVTPRDGKNLDPTEESKGKAPDSKEGRDKTVGEKQKDNSSEGENKANERGNAKDDKNTKLAEAQNNIVNKAADKDKIGKMLDGAFALTDGIIGLFGTDQKTRITQSIKGTVVRVGNEGSFVAYGGTFRGYGSTPNTRNAVIEVNSVPSETKTWDKSKNAGGVAYIYGGTFEAYSGANVFNMISFNEDQKAWQYTRDTNGVRSAPMQVPLSVNETGGVEVLYYQNQAELNQNPDAEPIPINTSNVQVRGGVFRCYYDLMNLAISESGNDSENFRKFPGTMGAVNLGVESFNNELIKDGRIQIIDKYGVGALVLMDEQKPEKAGTDGLYHYRLFCGDTELRYKSYLEVMPNNNPLINASKSLQLATYFGSGSSTKNIFQDDADNIRAPYRQSECYFDVMLSSAEQLADPDIPDSLENYSVKPNFYRRADKDNVQAHMDVCGQFLANSEVWYYPEPLTASGRQIPDFAYGYAAIKHRTGDTMSYVRSMDLFQDPDWEANISYFGSDFCGSIRNENDSIRKGMRYFTYKVYRVDPLTRTNLYETEDNDTTDIDKPLIEVRYGSSNDALKCKLPLKDLQTEIGKRKGDPNWKFQGGEMYRIVLEMEEYVGMNYDKNEVTLKYEFSQRLPVAKAKTSVIFRCYDPDEQKNTGKELLDTDFTPLQWMEDAEQLSADQVHTIELVNGKTGMTDWEADGKIFDVYYQWWETDADGNPKRMIAGTDNIFEGEHEDRDKHVPSAFNIGSDGKTYVNTVNPEDPKADSYGENGLPENPQLWNYKQLHMYTFRMTPIELLKRFPELNLSLNNNNVLATNTDSCYIPMEMAGKYVRVKAVVMNPKWLEIYDFKQTFWSHPIKVVSDLDAIKGDLSLSYSEGMNYATYNKPFTLSLNKLEGLTEGETVSEVSFIANGHQKTFTDLNLTDLSKLPSVKYPEDFYAEDYPLERLHGVANGSFSVEVTTYKDGKKFRTETILSTETPKFRYEVNAASLNLVGKESETYRLTDIQRGDYENGVPAFTKQPYFATIGWDFTDHTSTDSKVASLDQNGYIQFGGGYGETEITVNSPDGTKLSKKITVIRDYDSFAVSGIKPPVIGEPLSFNAEIPEDAPYHITDIAWMKGNVPVEPDEAADYFQPYTICVTVESNDFCESDGCFSAFSIAAEQADGSVDLVSDSNLNYDDARQAYDEETGEELERFTFRYTYPGQSNHQSGPIDTVYMDFPTEVQEGDNFLQWLEKAHVYTTGYDEGFEFILKPTYGADADAIAKAYGYSIGTNQQLNYFVRGVQDGLSAEIKIPAALAETGDKFADKVKLIINGHEGGEIMRFSSTDMQFIAQNTLTVRTGEAPPVKPVISVRQPVAVIGEPIVLEDLLESNAPGVTIRMDSISFDRNDDEYFTVDLQEGTLTPIKSLDGTNSWIYINYTLAYDADGDGLAEYQETGNVWIKQVYESAADIPEPLKAGKALITMLNPDGEEACTAEYTVGSNAALPEIEGAFITNIYDAAGKIVWLTSLKDGEQYTVRSVSADSIEIHSGADCVNAVVKDADGKRLEDIQISADGSHFTTGEVISDLEPKSEYTLYYKAGTNGTVYKRNFRTAKQNYGVAVGHTIVTDANLGDLEQDGWHYDPASKTLTLKNYTLKDSGTTSISDTFAGFTLSAQATIVSQDALTVHLIGDNTVVQTSSTLGTAAIFAAKDLTITGNGNLNIPSGDFALQTYQGDINLNGTGTLFFTGNDKYGFYAFYPGEGTVRYTNGTIDFQPCLYKIDNVMIQAGSMLTKSDKDKLDVSGAHHEITVEAAGADGIYRTISASEIPDVIESSDPSESYLRITPKHSDTVKVTDAENHVDGACDAGGSYYCVCECGHIGETTFEQPAGAHHLILHGAKAATCTESGTAAYWECTHCGECYADEDGTKKMSDAEKIIPPLGHSLTHHEGEAETCTKAGKAEYWSCSICGELFADADAEKLFFASDLNIPATGHHWIHVNKKPATCTEDGTIEHWKCENCGRLSADESGYAALTQDDLTAPATGHKWGAWNVTKQPTATAEGEEIRSCSRCNETEKRVIPADPSLTTTTTTTTTTSTTKATTSTTTTTTSTTKATTTTTATSTTKAMTTTTTTTSTTKAATTTTATSTTKETTTTTTTTSMTKATTTTTTTTSTTKATTTTTTTSTTKATTTTTTTTSTTKETTTTTTATSTTKATTTTTTTTSTTKATTTTTTTTSTTKATTTTTTTTSTTKATTTTTTATSTTKATTTTTTTSTTKATTTTTATSTTKATTTTTTTTFMTKATTTTTTTTSTTKAMTTTTTTSTTKATTTTTTTSTTKATTTTTATSTTKETTTTTTTTSTTKETTTTTTTTSTTKATTTTTATSTTKATTTTTTTTSTTKATTTTTATSTTKATTTTTATSTTKATTTTTTSTTKATMTTTTTSMTETTTIASESVTGPTESQTSETTVTSETTPTEPAYTRGDVNEDGEINVADAQLALNAYVKAMAGKESNLTEQQTLAADVNEDQEISVNDAQTILLYYVRNTLSGSTVTWDELLGRNKPAEGLPLLTTIRTVFMDEDEPEA